MGIAGAGVAIGVTYGVSFLVMVVYTKYRANPKMLFWPDRTTFEGISGQLKFGLSCTLMFCLEWWSYEFLILGSAYLGSVSNAVMVI
jgi:MATE family multidrug resistance protein